MASINANERTNANANAVKKIVAPARRVADSVKVESLNYVVAGFSFAAAIAWMDLVRWAIANLIKLKQNGGSYFLLTALFTTLLSVLVFMLIQRYANGRVNKPKPVYAVTA